jgi:hypothetical protein
MFNKHILVTTSRSVWSSMEGYVISSRQENDIVWVIIAYNSDDTKYVLPSILSPPLSWHTFYTPRLLMWCFQWLPIAKLLKICRCHGSPVSTNMTVVQKAAKFLGALTSLSHPNSQLRIISTPLMRSTFSIHGFPVLKKRELQFLGKRTRLP